jgi:hypothetical protein
MAEEEEKGKKTLLGKGRKGKGSWGERAPQQQAFMRGHATANGAVGSCVRGAARQACIGIREVAPLAPLAYCIDPTRINQMLEC